jgi:hypothetical protein
MLVFGLALLAGRKAWARLGQARSAQRALLASVPLWCRLLCMATLGYVALNFVSFMASSPGDVSRVGDEYHLTRKGVFLRTLSPEEARSQAVSTTRGFSGHWILFSLLGAVGFAYVIVPRQPAQDRSTA